jgi:hypothetical protein
MIGVESALASSETAEALWPDWTELEQRIARTAFDAAQARAISSLISEIQLQAALVESSGALWQLHDHLSIQRHRIEGRFDFRPQPILFLFASLVKDKLLDLAELEGLADAKLAKIRAMAQF